MDLPVVNDLLKRMGYKCRMMESGTMPFAWNRAIVNDRLKAGNSSVLHSSPFVPRLVFFHPFKSKNQARHSVGAPTCDITALRPPQGGFPVLLST
ncbi:hypothetical protein AVEN_121944-1 [Araneus ventricosus]|uniref:Uncharacterized protein n=1 Tax=Araneus ventricosus TaxID=182803 RepID=A0A4Y2RRJ0_ARAVE|nr:hypothetical protein AVEN_243077-1 [Araneus ventricosus]GBN78281.1 hypothetical protein AVEN_121944-1 [Araneus ventricosus]